MNRLAPVDAASLDAAAREHRASPGSVSVNAAEVSPSHDPGRFYNGGPLARIIAVSARLGFPNRCNGKPATDLEARPRAAIDTLEKSR